jgi:hypothetical protein
MKKQQVTVLTNSQIKHLNADYLKTVLYSRRDSFSFFGEPVTITMSYKNGKSSLLIFRLGNVRFNTVDDIVKVTMHQLESVDKNLKYEKLYLRFTLKNVA